MATWRAALRQGRGLWASRGQLGVAVDRLSLNLCRRHYSPEPESTVKKFSGDISFLGKPGFQNTLIRPAPCEEDSRGAVYAAEYALEVHNAKFHQGVCLTRVVRAHVLRMGWSIYSVSFEGRDRKGDVRLYHAYVLHDLAGKLTRLFKFEVDESFSKNSFSQTLKHSDPADIDQGDNHSCTWESKKIAIVPIDIYEDVETEAIMTDHFSSLVQMINSKEGCYIHYSSFISASKADIWNGGVLYFLVMEVSLNQTFRSFLAVIKARELLVFRPVDELF